MSKEDIVVHQFDKLTAEQQQKIASKGGKASVAAKRKKKLFKEQIELLLSLPLKDEKAKKQLEALGIDTENMDNQMALVISAYKKGLKTGDKSILEFFRDTTDGKPVEKLEVSKTTDETVAELENYLSKKETNE